MDVLSAAITGSSYGGCHSSAPSGGSKRTTIYTTIFIYVILISDMRFFSGTTIFL